MGKINKTVLRETKYIAFTVIILSIFMQLIFIGLEKWDITVLLGNLLSGIISILNFLLMGLTIQKVVSSKDGNTRNVIRLSESLRTLMVLLAMIFGVVFPCFNTVTALVPLFFPRIAIIFRPLFGGKYDYEKPIRGEIIEEKKSNN